MQIISSPKVHSVIVIGSGASGGMAAWNLTRQGVDVLLLDAGDEVRSRHLLDARAPVGSARAPRPRPVAADVLPRHEGTALRRARGPALRPLPGVGPRRQDEHLGPRQPPAVRSRLQGTGQGRLGDTLADFLRRHLALLRSGRAADRRLRRHRRFRLAAGQRLPAAAAGAALRRAPAAEGGQGHRRRHRRRTPRQHDEADARLPGLPPLRQLRRRLRHGVLLQLRRSPAALRAEDRQARDPLERGGGADPGRRQGPRQGRPVLRSPDRRRAAGAGQGGRGRGQLRRLDAPAPQLEVDRVSERPRQQLGRDRPLPVRAAPVPHPRLAAAARRHGRRATIAASAASTSTCRGSIIATATAATTCAASACSSGTPAPATPARTAAATASPASASR